MSDNVRAIKERVDLVSVVSRYLTLTKSGQGFKGRCPFHKDDTPSFMVSPEKGLWHCFGCGEGGDLFGFVMKMERLTFPEALERLASEAGITLERKGDGEKDRLRPALAEAAEHFARNLADSKGGRRAREYLVGRGFDEASWGRYGLGYALSSWDDLKAKLGKRYGEKLLVDLGLLVSGKETSYDRFRDRVIFPIYDLANRPIAFGGRAFEGEPKYLNSPKTPLFDKGRELYGLSWARDEIARRQSAVLVEGYTDVLSLHQAGLANAVGSMGTALTQEQADLLGRFAKEVVVAYDRDAAGGAAALRGMQILRNSSLEVRVARFPEGDDPDSLVRRDGREAVEEALAEARPFHLVFIDALRERHNLADLSGKEAALAEARPFYQGLASLPLRQEIAGLVADLLDLPVERVMEDLGGRRALRRGEEAAPAKERWGGEEVILALLLRGEVAWERVAAHAGPEDFSEGHRPIVEAIAGAAEPFDPSQVIARLDEESARRASYLALAPVEFSDAEKAVTDALRRLVRLPEIEGRLASLRDEIRHSEAAGDRAKLDELQGAYRALVAEKVLRRRNGRG
jgi:DNA primase